MGSTLDDLQGTFLYKRLIEQVNLFNPPYWRTKKPKSKDSG